MQIELSNDYIMVRSMERKNAERKTASGLIISESTIEDEQVASGEVVQSDNDKYKPGDVLFFHKVLPIDVSMKYGEELETFWFISPKDVIFKLIPNQDKKEETEE